MFRIFGVDNCDYLLIFFVRFKYLVDILKFIKELQAFATNISFSIPISLQPDNVNV